MRIMEDGTMVIDETITDVTNQVRNSDGQVTKGKVNTYSRTGFIDAEGNRSYSPKVRVGTRDQKDGEFKELDAWTGFISDYSANSSKNYNIQSYNELRDGTVRAGLSGVVPLAAVPTISLSAMTKSVLSVFGISLSGGGVIKLSSKGLDKKVNAKSNYMQI